MSQRYFTEKLENNNFILSDNDNYHIKTVMRCKTGSVVEVVYNKKLYLGCLDEHGFINKKEEIVVNKNKNCTYTICLPLLSEQKMSFVLQKVTELGIDKIIPVITARSIVKLDGNKIKKKIERWQTICKEASEQSKRIDIPVITDIKKLSELNMDGLKILCSTTEQENTIKNVLKNKKDDITFIVGPEGGLEDKEEELLVSKGFIKTTLGENILRVETAPIYVLSVLKYEEW